MSEVLRELVVQLSVDSGNTASDLKGLADAVKQADANFRAAGAGVEGFEGSTKQAEARVTQLTERLNAQEAAVKKQASALEASKAKLAENAERQAKYAAKIAETKAALEKEVAANGKGSAAAQELAAQLQKLEGQHAALERQAVKMAQGIRRGETALTNASSAARETELALRQAHQELNKAPGLWSRAGKAIKEAEPKLRAAGEKTRALGRGLTRGLTLPIVTAGGAMLGAAISWESAFTGVRKTVNGTEEQMAALKDGILDMSQTLPSSAEAIAQVAENAGQLGIKRDSVLDFSRTMIDLGNTTNLSADEGAIALAQFTNITQMSQSKFQNLGSVIVDLGNNYATTERDIVNMGTRLASAGKQINLSEAQIMALATAAASVGLEAEAGGTALSTVLLNMDMAAAKGGKAIKGYADIAGQSAKDFAASWKADPARAMNAFVSGLGRVKAEGGNVALTLEKMGYTEKRVRDALMRLSGAGDTLSGALGRADEAWKSNSALTAEASLRYGTSASQLAILKNRAVAVGISFGETMTPYMRQALDAVSRLVDGFKALPQAQQESIIKWAAMAAALGPVVSLTGKLMTTGASLIKLFSGLGVGGLGVAAIAALVGGMALAVSQVETADERLRRTLGNISLQISPQSQQAITDGINQGIVAANKVHEIAVRVDADTTELKNKLAEAFSDGKLDRKEYTAASRYAREVVAPDILAAKKELDDAVAAYRQSLSGALNAEGQPLTEAEKETLVADFREKNGAQITELESALTAYQGLLTAIKNQGGSATKEQIADLEKAIEKVGALRKAIDEAKDQTVGAQKANYALTTQGKGNEKSMAAALGYVEQSRTLALTDAQEKLDKSLSQAGENATAAAKAYQIFDKETAAANKSAQTGYERIAAGVAKSNPEIAKQIEGVTKWSGLVKSTNDLLTKTDWTKPEEQVKKMTAAFGKGGELREYLSKDQLKLVNRVFGDGKLSAADMADLSALANSMRDAASKALEEATKNPEQGPVNSLIKGLLDVGAFQALDPTTIQGPLLNVLQLVDLKSGGQTLGAQVPEGIKLGINAGAQTSLSEAALSPLRTALEASVRGVFKIRSPSRIMIEPGRQIPAGIAVGISSNTSAVVNAIRGVYGAAIAEAKRLDAELKRSMPTLNGLGGGGGGSGTNVKNVDNSSSSTVNVGQLVVKNDTDITSLSAQIAAQGRRSRAAYGY